MTDEELRAVVEQYDLDDSGTFDEVRPVAKGFKFRDAIKGAFIVIGCARLTWIWRRLGGGGGGGGGGESGRVPADGAGRAQPAATAEADGQKGLRLKLHHR